MSLTVKAGVLASAFVPVLVPASTSGDPNARAAGKRVVTVDDIAFEPPRIAIRKGTTVVWRFRDSTFHNVTSRGKRRFSRSRDKRRGTHRVRFRKAGRYRYACTLHPLVMKGRVAVR